MLTSLCTMAIVTIRDVLVWPARLGSPAHESMAKAAKDKDGFQIVRRKRGLKNTTLPYLLSLGSDPCEEAEGMPVEHIVTRIEKCRYVLVLIKVSSPKVACLVCCDLPI